MTLDERTRRVARTLMVAGSIPRQTQTLSMAIYDSSTWTVRSEPATVLPT